MDKIEKASINNVKKRDRRDQKELHEKLEMLKPWQRQVFPDLINKSITGKSITEIAQAHKLRRETVSRFYHSKVFEDMAVLYAKEEIVLELLPLAREAIKDILLDGENSQRAKIALEIYKMAKLTQIQENKQHADNIYNFNINNKTINQLNITELENLAKEKILEIKKLVGEK